MGFFSSLFGGKDKGDEKAKPDGQNPAGKFNAAWEQAKKRFAIVIEVDDIELPLVDSKTGQEAPPHVALASHFAKWQTIKSDYDRRSLLFSVLYEFAGSQLKGWQVANYLVAERYPQKAMDVLEEAGRDPEHPEDYLPSFVAVARAFTELGHYERAVYWGEEATKFNHGTNRYTTVHADALHMAGDHERAHNMYKTLLAGAKTSAGGSGPDGIREMFLKVFALETGVLPSPVFALQIAKSLSAPGQATEFWRLAETEFYHSHYFRMHHAYHLAESGDMARSLSKLVTLVKEMPWLEDASLNLQRIFAAVDPEGKIMPEFQTQLRQTIQKNAWSADGKHITTIRL